MKKRELGEELGEFLDIIFREMEREGETVSLDSVVEYVYTFFLIAHEIAPGIIASTVKLISDHPEVMKELQVHQFFSICGYIEKKYILLTYDWNWITIYTERA